MAPFKQDPHKLLLIPGPIELTDDVLLANAHPSMSHMSPDFVSVFGDSIRMTRQVLFTDSAQPFLIAGSGTLGWDFVSANLVEPTDPVLVLNNGYFGDSFVDCLETYGAKVDQIKAPLGGTVSPEQVKPALSQKKYKILAFTHVDTSTGVLSDAQAIAKVVKEVSPETLIVLDAVCSVGSEEIQFDSWGLDVVLTASQKGLSAPPGLSITIVSQRALKIVETRKTPISSYYANWRRWLPIMKAYENGTAQYFATPSVNLIYSLHASLKTITSEKAVAPRSSLSDRFRLHKETSRKLKEAVNALGLQQVPLDEHCAANGMTAIYFPDGLKASDVLPQLAKRDIVIAGGLHKDIKDKYFRIGHMGETAVNPSRGDIDKLISELRTALTEAGYKPTKP